MIAGSPVADVQSVLRSPKSHLGRHRLGAGLLRERGHRCARRPAASGRTRSGRIDITQEQNYIVLDLLRQDVTMQRVDHSEYSSDTAAIPPDAAWWRCPFLEHRGEPLALELTHFADCRDQPRTPRVTGEAGLRALELALRVAAGRMG